MCRDRASKWIVSHTNSCSEQRLHRCIQNTIKSASTLSDPPLPREALSRFPNSDFDRCRFSRNWDGLHSCSRLRKTLPTRHHGTNVKSCTRKMTCGSTAPPHRTMHKTIEDTHFHLRPVFVWFPELTQPRAVPDERLPFRRCKCTKHVIVKGYTQKR